MPDWLKNILSTGSEVINERLSSPFWAPFIFIFVAYYWKAIYVTIFVDQDLLTDKTKLQYLIENIPGRIIQQIPNEILFIVFVFLYYVFVKFVINNTYLLKAWSLRGREKVLDKALDVIEKQNQIEIKKEDLEAKWNAVYEEIKRTRFVGQMNSFSDFFVRSNGDIRALSLPSDVIAYFMGKGVIERDSNNTFRYNLTELGSYILSRYLEENSKII